MSDHVALVVSGHFISKYVNKMCYKCYILIKQKTAAATPVYFLIKITLHQLLPYYQTLIRKRQNTKHMSGANGSQSGTNNSVCITLLIHMASTGQVADSAPIQ